MVRLIIDGKGQMGAIKLNKNNKKGFIITA